MKKITLSIASFIILTLGVSLEANSQVVTQGSSHIFVGYGLPNIPAMLVTALGAGGGSSFGPFVASYQYGVIDKLAIGGQIGYASGTSSDQTWTEFNGSSIVTQHYSLTLSIVTVMAKADYHYLSSDKADLYSGLMVGYGIASVSTSGTKDPSGATISAGGTSYAITAIGFRYIFTDNIGAYADLGYGVNGIITVGVSAKFGK